MNCAWKWKSAVWLTLAVSFTAQAQPQPQQDSAAGAAARKLGTVKSIAGKTLVLKPDSGPDINITLAEGIRILRLAPGQTDLKSAAPMTLGEVQVGDRMLVRGTSGDKESIVASSLVVMKQADL